MAGVTVSGVLWAIFQNNAGGAWDNAKKSFEAGVEINGEMTYKGSDAHKAAVTGDTVGDPFKDTSGPSMNILIKLTCLIGLVIAPILGGHSADGHNATTEIHEVQGTANSSVEKEVKVDMNLNDDGRASAVVTTIVTENGKETKSEQTFQGTEAEVKAQVEALKNVDVKVEKSTGKDTAELQGVWVLDGSHSYVDFSIRHIVAKSKGSFKTVAGVIDFSNTPSMNITIEVASINTSNEKRDKHLRTDEYFDVAKFPTMTFVSKSFNKTSDGMVVTGDLTIKDVTKEVELPLTYLGKQDTPWGFPSAAFEGEITVSRSEFGVGEKGGLLGDDVTVDFSIEINPKKEE